VAAWFFAIFTGSLLAGAVGTLWSVLSPEVFFCVLAVLALISAGGLRAMERATERVEEEHSMQAVHASAIALY
jgi:POT family proton-dependent oligopeptide transporter